MVLYDKSTLFTQGNWLTRRPCNGDEFEIRIFEAKTQNAGICRSCPKRLLIIGTRVIQVQTLAIRLRSDVIFLFKGLQKTRNLWFLIIPIIFKQTFTCPFSLSSQRFTARVFRAKQRIQTTTRRHYDAMSSCKPKCIFFVHLPFFSAAWTLVSISFQVFPCTIHLLGASNIGSMWFTLTTTNKGARKKINESARQHVQLNLQRQHVA